ncbi:MAG: hypothetical protein M5R36_21450 [Deltaproteobacteria bacterium]|nr:hypothetical protein [Deltaproteobacteria bacterium]
MMNVVETGRERAVKTAPEDPFFVLPADHEQAAGLSKLLLAVWGLALTAGFFLVGIAAGDFANLHKYGWDEDHQNYIMRLSSEEQLFYVALLLLFPAAIFLALAFEDRIGPRLVGWTRRVAADEKTAKKCVVGLTFLAVAAIGATAGGVLEGTWITDDENVYVFQSRIFAAGRLALPSLETPEDRIFNDNIFLVNNGKIYGQYPLGHSAFLLPGVIIGFPRLMTILAAALTILGCYLLGRELYDRRTGLAAAALLVFLADVSHDLRDGAVPRVDASVPDLVRLLSYTNRQTSPRARRRPDGVVFRAGLSRPQCDHVLNRGAQRLGADRRAGLSPG